MKFAKIVFWIAGGWGALVLTPFFLSSSFEPRPPLATRFVERLIGSIRRECLDHVVVLNRRHLTRLLKKYFAYYHGSRTHLALAKDAPESRAIMSKGKIIAIPQVGGLHHRYERLVA